MPTESRPSTSAKIRQRISSRTVTGPRLAARWNSGAGSSALASFPLTVSGSSGSVTAATGIMYSGRLSLACSHRSATETVSLAGTR
ncbi:hypothetical protein GCM10010468_70830 [Actinocorallia longicatena]|uniref:Ig-like domain-containing protein n=1 Tax=Actinocorallia longicatena TaxID=111803 RepID=A0ABP6QP45_9ACTN